MRDFYVLTSSDDNGYETPSYATANGKLAEDLASRLWGYRVHRVELIDKLPEFAKQFPRKGGR